MSPNPYADRDKTVKAFILDTCQSTMHPKHSFFVFVFVFCFLKKILNPFGALGKFTCSKLKQMITNVKENCHIKTTKKLKYINDKKKSE